MSPLHPEGQRRGGGRSVDACVAYRCCVAAAPRTSIASSGIISHWVMTGGNVLPERKTGQALE